MRSDLGLPTGSLLLFPQHPKGGPITFDAQVGGSRVEGRVVPTDPEYAAAGRAIESCVQKWTLARPMPPMIEVNAERVHELALRVWR